MLQSKAPNMRASCSTRPMQWSCMAPCSRSQLLATQRRPLPAFTQPFSRLSVTRFRCAPAYAFQSADPTAFTVSGSGTPTYEDVLVFALGASSYCNSCKSLHLLSSITAPVSSRTDMLYRRRCLRPRRSRLPQSPQSSRRRLQSRRLLSGGPPPRSLHSRSLSAAACVWLLLPEPLAVQCRSRLRQQSGLLHLIARLSS